MKHACNNNGFALLFFARASTKLAHDSLLHIPLPTNLDSGQKWCVKQSGCCNTHNIKRLFYYSNVLLYYYNIFFFKSQLRL